MSQYQGEHRSTLTTSTSTAGHLVSSETSESSFFFDRDMTAFTVSPRDMMVYDGPSSHGFTLVLARYAQSRVCSNSKTNTSPVHGSTRSRSSKALVFGVNTYAIFIENPSPEL